MIDKLNMDERYTLQSLHSFNCDSLPEQIVAEGKDRMHLEAISKSQSFWV